MRAGWFCAVLLIVAGLAWQVIRMQSEAGKPSIGSVAAIPSLRKPDSPVREDVAAVGDPRNPMQRRATEPDSAGQADVLKIAQAIVHADDDANACLGGTAKAAQPQATAIHRWTDRKGVIHFSDQAPGDPVRDHRRIEVSGLPPIVVHATGYDVNLPENLAQNAIASAQAIDRVMRESLGVVGEPGLVLTIEFVAGADAWALRSGNPAMPTSAGTYSTRDRTIHVRFQENDESNALILRHEITHALVHERVGRLPTAINEGLASYFEHLTVQGMGAQFAIGEQLRSVTDVDLEQDGPEALVDLLAREGPDFYGPLQERNYLRAFALVAVMMDSGSGRAALGAVLAAQRQNPCQPVKAEVILDHGYPGGLAALARAWADWLLNPPRRVVSF